jgi:NAD(P)-dependent dehydrogenase (short-subunit alcohol dehydrogenase family)
MTTKEQIRFEGNRGLGAIYASPFNVHPYTVSIIQSPPIMNVASVGSFLGVAGLADYTATKAATLSFHEGTLPSSPLPAPGSLTTISLN